ncbi:MAG: SDR family NAD(P)-dependent oxidoreductase [Actinomycetota bacterium]
MPEEQPTLDATEKVALVTGGASGIGLACARRLVSEGARVAILDIDAATGERAAGEIGATFVHADASNSGAIAEAFGRVHDDLGGLDIALLNAGIYRGVANLDDLSDDDYRRIVAVNVDGVVFGVREASRLMAEAGGHIVATASLSGVHAWPLDPLYSLTKHAVVGLVRSLASNLSERRIALNCLCPPVVDTPMADPFREQFGAALDGMLISTEDVAEALMRVLGSGKTGEAWFVGRKGDTRPVRFRSMAMGMGLAGAREA